MVDKKYLEDIFNTFNSNQKYSDLTSSYKLIVLCNLMLAAIENHLPLEVQKYAPALLNNGKELNLKMLQYKNNAALKIALKSHLILDLAGKLQ